MEIRYYFLDHVPEIFFFLMLLSIFHKYFLAVCWVNFGLNRTGPLDQESILEWTIFLKIF